MLQHDFLWDEFGECPEREEQNQEVVDVAEDRDEVRDEVDGREQVEDEKREPDAGDGMDPAVANKPSGESCALAPR